MVHLRQVGVACLVLFVAPVGRADENAAGVEYFEKRIRPLLAEHCCKCHGPKKQESKLRLDQPAGLMAGGESGRVIAPGRPEASLLITAVGYQNDDLQMPPDEKLSDAQIADLRHWVKIGAPFPKSVEPGSPLIDPAKASSTERAEFWAFQPLQEPSVPDVKNRTWPQSLLDHFILAELEKAAADPAPRADPRTLIRRMSFDLTGLPPTPQEVRAFEQHSIRNSQSAIRNLVDRLLASPRYGEKWGRHWLDVARYADSNGLDENIAHGNAWRYRDFVIAALNDDMPYDEFVVAQLAGDLLPTDDAELRNRRRIATGFLSLGPKVLAEVDERKMEMDIVDEQIDTVGKAFMGLTFGCARCHDHKFDPISMKDYYALAGIFKSTRTMEHFKKIARWQEVELAGAAYEQEKQKHGQQIAEAKKKVDGLVAAANKQLQEKLGAAAQFPEKPEEQYPPATRDELKQLREQLANLEKNPPQPPMAMGVQEGQITDVAVHVRGSHLTLGDRVPRRFPIALGGDQQTPIDERQSGRLQFARWLTSPDHPLTARVMVNRIWRWHFGRGLVATPDNFGQLGERPANQQLLDWLAVQFIRSGWSIKAMHRLIMLSSTYQMSSRANPKFENRNSKFVYVRRLEAEEVRDALLAVSGRLDPQMGGSMLHVENRKFLFDHTSKDETTYASRRRSVYLPVIRNHLYDAFSLFDYSDASMPNGNRASSTVAPQSLYMMNSDFVAKCSQQLASRLLDDDLTDAKRIELLYETAYARPPQDKETQRMLAFLETADTRFGKENDGDQPSRTRAWQLVCHAVLAANEFIYLR